MITPIDYKPTYLHSRDNHSLKQDLRFYLSKRLGFRMKYTSWDIETFGTRYEGNFIKHVIYQTMKNSRYRKWYD